MSNFNDYLTRICVQTAVYWGNPQEDGYGGKTYDAPVEISCRWEEGGEVMRDVNRIQNQFSPGEEFIPQATVYVLQDLDTYGRLYLGTLDDLDSADQENPEDVEEAYEIKKFLKIPAFRSTTIFLRKALLSLWQR